MVGKGWGNVAKSGEKLICSLIDAGKEFDREG